MALFLSCANGNHRPTSSYANGLVCCDVCGKVLHEDLYTDEPSFVKGAGGESKLSGSVIERDRDEIERDRRHDLAGAIERDRRRDLAGAIERDRRRDLAGAIERDRRRDLDGEISKA
ncbi:hypothetical protein SO802_006192 [Lithocarpus litseifolius]|uniref:Uncharacterized protein n=1 Tax=Lithocarpus litseifolius TaxID=425828 RepID=A0AAW2DLQ9_9ROSI